MRTPPVTLVALLSLVAVTNNACDGSRRASPMPPADSSESGPEVDVTRVQIEPRHAASCRSTVGSGTGKRC